MEVIQKYFSKKEEQEIFAHTITNKNGMKMTVINYGCIITELHVPDRNGLIENVVLGFDTIEEYKNHSPYFGTIVGRHAGRIKEGKFELDGVFYQLEQNNGYNHLHGGIKGFDKVIWDVIVKENEDSITLEYNYFSKNGECGYPANVFVRVIYTLNEENEVTLMYEGYCDKKTILNMTNHTYFNLSGNLKRTVEDHQLTLKSDRFLELNDELIPTGKMLEVEGTVFDFREGRRIMDGIHSEHVQNVLAGNGYDHPFLLRDNYNEEINLYDRKSGRLLVIETNQPAVVLYTGTQLTENYLIRGVQSEKYLGLCLETQGLPDAINNPHFPSTVIDVGESYLSVTKIAFRVK
ncbi:aldose epimerase family protein [Pseudoneobacillus sp. C159]